MPFATPGLGGGDAPPTRAAPAPLPGTADEGSGMNATNVRPSYSILITDDDRDCRETLREIMEPQGFRTLLA